MLIAMWLITLCLLIIISYLKRNAFIPSPDLAYNEWEILVFKTMKTVFKTMKEQWTDEKRIFLHPNVTKRRLVRLPIEKRWK